jgi:predicted dehydrogenase
MYTRRRFLGHVGSVAALGTGAWLAGKAGAKSVSANEKITMGHIGVGGMGNEHVNWFAGLDDVEIVALCDVDASHLQGTMDRLGKLRPGNSAKGYHDLRELLARDDIDAVSIATPDHWHALATILAFEAGKDVYCEKPLCHSVAESHAMLRARKRHDRVFQLGTQIHAGENYHRVIDIIHSGALGKISEVNLWKVGGSPGLGYPAPQAPPPELDWDFWQGPAPERDYVPERCHFSYRYFWDYSGGDFTDFWCHIADIAFWALEIGEPKTIQARGEAPLDGIADTPNTIDADFTFENLHMTWSSKQPAFAGAAGRGIGCRFVGENGWLVTDYDDRVICLDGKEMTDLPDVPKSTPRSPGHQRLFVDCVRSRALTESNLEYVQTMTLPMLLACISFRLGRKLTWDATTQSFLGDEAANRMLDIPYRAPWWLPA